MLSKRITAATALYGTGELLRGTVFLIAGALDQIGAGQPGREDFVERFTDKLMDRIAQRHEVVDPADLPMVLQIVRVAFDGNDPVAWREQAGPVPDSEPRTMTCALALIANFVDHVDGPGACERALLSTLGDASPDWCSGPGYRGRRLRHRGCEVLAVGSLNREIMGSPPHSPGADARPPVMRP
ncbi:hypothetical protein [Streptomyces sp. TLI_146]|uniref:hypothetical protein n=1 Tax=Streptomyces sp. TLI_146 TaxID=1938858 RepID=UPI000CC2D3A8|nr:hypothetical protein [Streptomyces sp. TLI_146]PKV82733.1 hypothetical protein BX283_0180 [Streptomyces sp. TLI_146]